MSEPSEAAKGYAREILLYEPSERTVRLIDAALRRERNAQREADAKLFEHHGKIIINGFAAMPPDLQARRQAAAAIIATIEPENPT